MADNTNTPEGILVLLKTKLSKSLGITPQMLKNLIDHFVTVNFGNMPSKTHFAKVNIYNELTSPKMTIKVFFKYLLIARIKKVEIIVIATTTHDKVVEAREEFNLINFGDNKKTESPRPVPEETTKEEKNGD